MKNVKGEKSKYSIDVIDTSDENIIEAIGYTVNDDEEVEVLPEDNSSLYSNLQFNDRGELITPPAENISKDIVVDLSTIHLYTDILRARGILEIRQKDLLNLENKVFLELPEDNESNILDNLEGMLNKDLDYILSNNEENVYTKGFKEDIRNMNRCKYLIYFISPRSNNIRTICQSIQNSHKHPGRVILCLIENDNGKVFNNKVELEALYSVGQTIVVNGGKFFMTLEDLANFINNN